MQLLYNYLFDFLIYLINSKNKFLLFKLYKALIKYLNMQ